MKNFAIALACFAALASPALAQKKAAPAKTAPKKAAAAPAKPAASTTANTSAIKTKRTVINGVPVLTRPMTNEVIVVQVVLRGGVNNYPASQEGLEALALEMVASGGTQSLQRTAFRSKLERLGASISASAGTDNSFITLTCLRQNWAPSWALFQDALLNPAFRAEDFKQMKDQALAGLQQGDADPDTYLARMSKRDAFEGTPYATDPGGSVEAVTPLTVEQARDHYKKIFNTGRLVVVGVGNFDEQSFNGMVSSLLGKVPTGTYVPKPAKVLEIQKNMLKKQERDIATNYMMGVLPAPVSTGKEYVAAQMAAAILYDRMFDEVRTKRNLSYAPQFSYNPSIGNPYSSLYVTTTDPNAASKVMMDVVRKVRKDGYTAKELTDRKQGFLTTFFLRNETNSSIASAIAGAELRGDYTTFDRTLDLVNKVTVEDINAYARTYLKNVRWVYLGKTEGLDENSFISPLN